MNNSELRDALLRIAEHINITKGPEAGLHYLEGLIVPACFPDEVQAISSPRKDKDTLYAIPPIIQEHILMPSSMDDDFHLALAIIHFIATILIGEDCMPLPLPQLDPVKITSIEVVDPASDNNKQDQHIPPGSGSQKAQEASLVPSLRRRYMTGLKPCLSPPFECPMCCTGFDIIMQRFRLIYQAYGSNLWFHDPHEYEHNCGLVTIKGCTAKDQGNTAPTAICFQCLQEHIIACDIDDRDFTCPCGCLAPLSDSEIYFPLDEQRIEALSITRVQQSLARTMYHCQTPDCTYFVELDPDEIANAADPTVLDCPKCKKQQCVRCKETWDAATTTARHICKEQAERLTSDVLKGVKRCPQCNTPYEKVQGCDQMKCKCGQDFCNSCNSVITVGKRHKCLAHIPHAM